MKKSEFLCQCLDDDSGKYLTDNERDEFNQRRLTKEAQQFNSTYSNPNYGSAGLLLLILFVGLIIVSL